MPTGDPRAPTGAELTAVHSVSKFSILVATLDSGAPTPSTRGERTLLEFEFARALFVSEMAPRTTKKDQPALAELFFSRESLDPDGIHDGPAMRKEKQREAEREARRVRSSGIQDDGHISLRDEVEERDEELEGFDSPSDISTSSTDSSESLPAPFMTQRT